MRAYGVGARQEQAVEVDGLSASSRTSYLPDQGHGLAVPDGRELPHHLRSVEEVDRAHIAQRAPVVAIGREGDVAVAVADDLRDEQARP